MKKAFRTIIPTLFLVIIFLTGCSSFSSEDSEDNSDFVFDPVEYVETVIGSSASYILYEEDKNTIEVRLNRTSLEYDALENLENTGRKSRYLDNVADIYAEMSESLSILGGDETISIQMIYRGDVVLEVQNGDIIFKGF